MSRRASTSTKLARIEAAKVGTRLDRNGIPIVGPETPLPPHRHRFAPVKRRQRGLTDDSDGILYDVEMRCACGDVIHKIEVEPL